MANLQKEFDSLIEEYTKFNQEFQNKAKAAFNNITKEFFELNKGITAIKWTQYTPYFNDGDPCEFNVYELIFTNATRNELDNVSSYGEYEGDDPTIWATESIVSAIEPWNGKYTDYYKSVRELISKGPNVDSCKLFCTMLQSSAFESLMLTMFGDGVIVTATKDGFDVNEYCHD